uniref:Methyltransferase-like protein 17, mitochondrial n=1 Tax=Timema poppense TaxID=170557 RepID=A0A7R9CR29_TIMPO|nr:unnamed protein product [Timema poppensis]
MQFSRGLGNHGYESYEPCGFLSALVRFTNEQWLCRLAFMANVVRRLNELNKVLQDWPDELVQSGMTLRDISHWTTRLIMLASPFSHWSFERWYSYVMIAANKPIKSLLEEAATLERHLHGRHPPKEEHELKILSSKVEQDIDSRSKIDISVLSEESRKHVLKIKQKQVRRRFHECVYHWKPIPYNHHKGLLYLLGRSAAEFAVLFKIFCEMKQRLPNLAPRTIFDFGSGVGTTTWAAREVWGNSLHEYFNVDCCAEMNNLASLLLRDGKEDKEMPLKGVFYRQFLPASHSLKYDIVVSAYSLFELPSSESRLETILALWNKTQAYLVIVEQGTNAGFKCPHDLSCPRFIRDDIPCNFEATYSPLTFGRNPEFKKERYSYVVLKKGHRPVEDRQWPRLVSPTLIRHKHAICRMCSSAGKLDEIIFTVSRHGK